MAASVASTTAPLEANGEWTSGWIQRMGHHEKLEGSVFADQVGHLHIEETSENPDGGAGTPDVVSESEAKASEGAAVEHTLVGRWWRVRFVNGGTKQGAFRLGVAAYPRSGDIYAL